MIDDLMANHIRCSSCASAVPVDALPLFAGACPWCLGRPKPYETRTIPAPPGYVPPAQDDGRRIRPVDELAPGTPAELVSIIHKCLSHQPGDRYESAAEISADLERWRTGHAVDAHSEAWWYRAWRFVTRRRLAVAAVVVVAGIVVGAAAIAIRRAAREDERSRELAAAWCKLGDAMLDRNDDVGAREAFTNAIALDPKPRTFRLRSFASWRLLDYRAAEADVTEAIALEPTFGPGFHHRADVRFAMGDSSGATRDIVIASGLARR